MKFILNGDNYDVTRQNVEARLRGVAPDQIYEHAVEVNGTLFPVKQVFAVATGRDVSEFTSQRAQDVLRRLGFSDPRRTPKPGPASPADPEIAWVLELRTLAGGHQAVLLADSQDLEQLSSEVANNVGGEGTCQVRAIHPDALGGEATFTVAWRNIATASIHQRVVPAAH
jgi:hypothetical protein